MGLPFVDIFRALKRGVYSEEREREQRVILLIEYSVLKRPWWKSWIVLRHCLYQTSKIFYFSFLFFLSVFSLSFQLLLLRNDGSTNKEPLLISFFCFFFSKRN